MISTALPAFKPTLLRFLGCSSPVQPRGARHTWHISCMWCFDAMGTQHCTHTVSHAHCWSFIDGWKLCCWYSIIFVSALTWICQVVIVLDHKILLMSYYDMRKRPRTSNERIGSIHHCVERSRNRRLSAIEPWSVVDTGHSTAWDDPKKLQILEYVERTWMVRI